MSGREKDQSNSRKVFIKSYGCQMNVYDATRMADVLAPEGYDETSRPEDADLIVLNTCHIREKAAEKVFSELGRLRELKNERAAAGLETRIAIAGCVAQAEGKEILHRAKMVDLVVGPQSYHRLPQLLNEAKDGRRIVDTDFPIDDKFDHLPRASRQKTLSRGYSAFVTIQEGCDKFCSFCVVPYTRGAEVSRPARAILDEVRGLADAGVREISFLGQNVNAYHGEGLDGRSWSLADLLEAAALIDSVQRLRYTTSHPSDMDDRLIALHGALPELMPYLHLPVQSGSNRMLAAMNRKHTREHYLGIIERVRRVSPDIALSSDFIVGFPGESDEDFEDTMRLIDEVRFAAAFSFKYSRRPGTPASDLSGQVDDAVATARLHRLQATILDQQTAFNRETIGRTVPVLVEKLGRHPGQVTGKSPYLQPVFFEGPESLVGSIVPTKITGISSNSLSATLAPAMLPMEDRTRQAVVGMDSAGVPA